MNINAEAIWFWVTNYSVKIVAAILILIVGRWLAGYFSDQLAKVLEYRKVEITLVKFLRNILYYALLAAVVIAALGQLGISTASFLTVVGAAGLAVGLALKDSLGNFASGVMLILFRPFKVGDFVNAGGVSGTVKEITIFNTELATPDNQKVIVPNGAIMGGVITNVTAHPTRRIDLVIGISYEDDTGKAKDILAQLIKEDGRILVEPAPTIAVAELADSSVNIIVRPWVNSPDYWAVRCDLIEKIKLGFDKAGISIPYPQRDVHLYSENKAAA